MTADLNAGAGRTNWLRVIAGVIVGMGAIRLIGWAAGLSLIPTMAGLRVSLFVSMAILNLMVAGTCFLGGMVARLAAGPNLKKGWVGMASVLALLVYFMGFPHYRLSFLAGLWILGGAERIFPPPYFDSPSAVSWLIFLAIDLAFARLGDRVAMGLVEQAGELGGGGERQISRVPRPD